MAGRILGRTLPALLEEGCDRHPNSQAFNQWTRQGWRSLSNDDIRRRVHQLAIGLVDLGLEPGDRVALLMHSGIDFCVVDFGSLLAGLVNVPLDLTQTIEHLIAAIHHSEANVLVISNLDLLAQIAPYLTNTPALRYVIVAEVTPNWQQTRSEWVTTEHKSAPLNRAPSNCLQIPMVFHPVPEHPISVFPHCIQLLALSEVIDDEVHDAASDRLQQLYAALSPNDLATIIYVPDEQGQPQGVMLTHENLSGDALASFSSIPQLGFGQQERIISFLPLNHVLARTLLYGHIYYGHSIYFTGPNRLMKHLQDVRPTVLTTVPIVLEKIYEKWVEFAAPPGLDPYQHRNQIKRLHRLFGIGRGLSGTLIRLVGSWALNLAKRYPIQNPKSRWYAIQHRLANWVVFSRWRSPLGGHLKYLICGGAVLSKDIATVFAAAGIPVMHGYGLTQASAVVCFNRGTNNRPGTVGMPIPGVEVAIAPDGEILTRSPYITSGYYRNPDATQRLIDRQGWLHTGDLGEITDDGFLKITGVKKILFKLSTGKYIAPRPIEQRLKQSAFVKDAFVVGSGRKFCAALIIPNWSALEQYMQASDASIPTDQRDALHQHSCVQALYQSIVDAANCHLPYWSTIKQFQLVDLSVAELSSQPSSVESPALIHSWTALIERFAQAIDRLYGPPNLADSRVKAPTAQHNSTPDESGCPPTPAASCPTVAKSLNPRLTSLNAIAPFVIALSTLIHLGMSGFVANLQSF